MRLPERPPSLPFRSPPPLLRSLSPRSPKLTPQQYVDVKLFKKLRVNFPDADLSSYDNSPPSVRGSWLLMTGLCTADGPTSKGNDFLDVVGGMSTSGNLTIAETLDIARARWRVSKDIYGKYVEVKEERRASKERRAREKTIKFNVEMEGGMR